MHELFNRFYQKDLRRGLRNESTPAELFLWERLKNKQLGYKFRRQHGIDSFIVDFYCSEKQLAIELDGSQHFTEEGKHNDEERTKIIDEHHIRIIRFRNEEVLSQIETVIDTIKQVLESQSNRPKRSIS